MKSVFIDLELNQNLVGEQKIIQIGAVLVTLKQFEVLDTFKIFCNPEELISPYITELTGIQQTHVDSAPSIKEGLTEFWAWLMSCNIGGSLIAWGSDVDIMKKQSLERGVALPKKLRPLDFKSMFKWYRSVYGLPLNGGLKDSLRIAGLDFVGKQHDAFDDALNTARLGAWAYHIIYRFRGMEKVFQQKGISTKEK